MSGHCFTHMMSVLTYDALTAQLQLSLQLAELTAFCPISGSSRQLSSPTESKTVFMLQSGPFVTFPPQAIPHTMHGPTLRGTTPLHVKAVWLLPCNLCWLTPASMCLCTCIRTKQHAAAYVNACLYT